MNHGRRRSMRNNLQKSPEPSPLSTRSATPSMLDVYDTEPSHSSEDSCPACKDGATHSFNAFDKENWIRCDICKVWYHWRCAGDGSDVEALDKWYCKPCLEVDPTRVITFKAPARKSTRKRARRDYANLNSGQSSDPNRWMRTLEGKTIKDDPFQRLNGNVVGLEWLAEDESVMKEPFVIDSPDGLGMKMPPTDFTVDDVVQLIGDDAPVEVIDVASQSTSPGWTLRKWCDYYNLEPTAREKICNVISLEVSGTKLSDMILPPRLVRELDWVENYWPSTRKGKGHAYPKVQLYCLMGVATAWTDWHIDFAGSSVYYHILSGSKIFYFIRPTSENLAAYERWSGTELQYHSWLGDMVDEVFKVELTQGNTMIIPSGWIHAVYTPVDTLVFGGNFLHSYNVATQLRVRDIEIATEVPKKFRFPLFSKLCWYVGDKFLRDLKSNSVTFSTRVLVSMLALAEFLVSEARILERGGEQAKREVKDQIPSERIKDAPAMARELRWRLKSAAGYSSDDDRPQGPRKGKEGINGNKRKRIDLGSSEPGPFRNYMPKRWDRVVEEMADDETVRMRVKAPGNEEDWKEQWGGWNKDEDEDGDGVEVRRQRDIVVKVRRTLRGVERQRIERVVEEWLWDSQDH